MNGFSFEKAVTMDYGTWAYLLLALKNQKTQITFHQICAFQPAEA
jgi:hypothetical protein